MDGVSRAFGEDELKAINAGVRIFGNSFRQFLPLISVGTMFTGYVFIVYYLWKKFYRDKPVRYFDGRRLSEEEVKVRVSITKLKEQLSFQETRKEKVSKKLETAEGYDKKELEKVLEASEQKAKVLEAELDTQLDRLEFIGHLQLLVSHKKFLEEKGVWDALEDLQNKRIPKLDKFVEEATINHGELRDYLSSLKAKDSFYSEIARA